jgi:signal transduction histidine kinase
MSSESWALRRRLAIALTALAVIASTFLAVAFISAEEFEEERSLRELLRHELRLHTSADGEPVAESTVRYFRPARPGAERLPPSMAGLPPGSFTRIDIDGRPYRVLVEEIAPGDRAYLAYDLSLGRERAYRLVLILLACTIGVAMAAWWMAGRLARRVLTPMSELVDEIRALDLHRRGQRLAPRSGDDALQVIVSALNVHMAELDALVESEQAFASAASHELRTPLTVIDGAAAVLAENAQVPKEVLARIERAVAQATQDLDALLALSRSREQPESSAQRVDQLLPRLAAFHEEAARSAGTQVQWQLEPVTRAVSPGALSIVFTNLLRNALRATPGGHVRIRLDDASLAIVDDGPGMPAELLTNPDRPAAVLAPRRDGGSGMGLYIASTLAQRQGWRLQIGAAPGRGTCVEILF